MYVLNIVLLCYCVVHLSTAGELHTGCDTDDDCYNEDEAPHCLHGNTCGCHPGTHKMVTFEPVSSSLEKGRRRCLLKESQFTLNSFKAF